MTLTRKTRASGSSLVITIPSQLVEAFNIHTGDKIEIIPLPNGEIKIRKYNQELTHPKKQN
jgi:AbrB family looped-hinge helix DNA binding protein